MEVLTGGSFVKLPTAEGFSGSYNDLTDKPTLFSGNYNDLTGKLDTLARQFPDNREDLREYTRRLQTIADASPLYNLRKVEENVFIEADYIKTSINDFIASVTDNRTLRDVLAGNLPLYAGVRDKTPTYIHALINNFYIQSAWRIIGGQRCHCQGVSAAYPRFWRGDPHQLRGLRTRYCGN